MIRVMLAALFILGTAWTAVAEGPVCSSSAGGVFRCSAGTFCCKVPQQVSASGYNCCRPGDRCVGSKGCFFEVTLRTDATWGSAQRKSELQVVRDLVTEIPDAQGALKVGDAFKRWVNSDVTLVRLSRPSSPLAGEPVLGVTPGVLNVRDTFFSMATKAEQTNVLTFELAKVLWYKINGNDTSNAKTDATQKFVTLLNAHRSAMSLDALQSASLENKELVTLFDRDLQSRFAYAARIALLNLNAPADAPLSVSSDWVKAREAMQLYLLNTALKK